MATIAPARRRESAHSPRAHTRVLLIEEGWSQTLYLARALERTGYAVTVATANGGSARMRHGSVEWCSVPAVVSPRFIVDIERMIAAFDRVLPLTEATMARLWDAQPAWSDRIFPATDGRQQRLVRDKHALLEHLAARGAPVPRQCALDLGVEEIVARLGLPVVIKGATGAGGARVRIVDDRAQLARGIAWAEALEGAWVAQEHVHGPTFLVGGVFHEGRPLRIYAAEKLEQHPPRTGPAIRLRSDDDPALLDLGMRVFRELRWTGFGSADLIRRDDGSYVVLEANPRLWGSIAGAASAGVDLFTPFAELLAGRVPSASLGFTANEDCRIFPRYLLSPRYRCVGTLRQALADLVGPQGEGWRHPRFFAHIVGRLIRSRGLQS